MKLYCAASTVSAVCSTINHLSPSSCLCVLFTAYVGAACLSRRHVVATSSLPDTSAPYSLVMPPASVHEHMRSANAFVARAWCPHAMLGAESARNLGYAGIVGSLHELPCTVAYMMAGLHAMDGVLLKICQKAIATSLGVSFYHSARTSKSGTQRSSTRQLLRQS